MVIVDPGAELLPGLVGTGGFGETAAILVVFISAATADDIIATSAKNTTRKTTCFITIMPSLMPTRSGAPAFRRGENVDLNADSVGNPDWFGDRAGVLVMIDECFSFG